jgi:hypothetical protein
MSTISGSAEMVPRDAGAGADAGAARPPYARPLVVQRVAFDGVAARHGLDGVGREAFWGELEQRAAEEDGARGAGLAPSRLAFGAQPASSRLVRVLLYVGAATAVGSFGWWAAGYESWALWQLLLLAAVCALLLAGLAAYGRARHYRDLTGVTAVVLAFLVPLVAYRLLSEAGFAFSFDFTGFYAWIDGGWVWLELSALVATIVLYLLVREPLLGLPFFLFAWFAAMDVTARSVGVTTEDVPTIGRIVFSFGAAAFVIGVALDVRGLRRHALWAHVFAVLGVVSGLALWTDETGWNLLLVSTGSAFLVLGTGLGRTTYLVAGALALVGGISGYAPAPIWLTAAGLGLVLLATVTAVAVAPRLRRPAGMPVARLQRD